LKSASVVYFPEFSFTTSMLVKPLADHSGNSFFGKEWLCKIIRASHKGWSVGGGH